MDSHGRRYGNVLQAALHSPRILVEAEEIVRISLEKNADVEGPSENIGHKLSPLIHASRWGMEGTVKLLLKNGANPNTRGHGEWGTALHEASRIHHTIIMEMLLDKNSDVNIQGGQFGNALAAAVAHSQFMTARSQYMAEQENEKNNKIDPRRKAITMLLEAGADVNAPSGYYGSVLRLAVERRQLWLVNMLFRYGATVDELWPELPGSAEYDIKLVYD